MFTKIHTIDVNLIGQYSTDARLDAQSSQKDNRIVNIGGLQFF